MSSNAFAGVGTQLKRGNGASAEVFTALAEINSISGPSNDTQEIEVTSLDSTDGWREYILGFKDGGELTFEMNFTYAAYSILFGDWDDRVAVNFQLVLSDTGATTFSFAALVKSCPVLVPFDDKVTANITLRITGPVALAA